MITEIIEAKHYLHTSGRTASIYGAAPWTTESDKANWSVKTTGFTWRKDDGTVGLGRVPAKTMEEAVEVMNRVNSLGVRK